MKKFTVRLLSVLLVLSVLLSLSCSGNDAGNGSESTAWERAACLFTPPEGYDVECGYLTVPEDRNLPDGNTIRIYFAVFKTPNEDAKSDPIVYLGGGPGENSLETASYVFQKRFAPLLENRDLIILDQRGTGYSEPSLFCPELVDVYFENLDKVVSIEEAIAMHVDTLKRCHDRFVSDGIDLSDYNTAENAADLEDLRIALGYDEWNLLGVSYGTRLALTAMRDHPEGIRSVILASTVPLQTDVYTESAATFNRSLDLLLESCAADPVASIAYPDLETTLFETVARLNETPAELVVNHPFTGIPYDVVISGYDLLDFIFEALYSTELLPLLPKIISDAAAGTFGTLGILLTNDLVNIGLMSMGMHYSVQFNEELPFNDPAEMEASIERYPEMEEYLSSGVDFEGRLFELYEYWDVEPADPIEDQPVTSDIPTLILAGEFDPVTPPSWGRLAAETLSASRVVELPAVSHDTIFSGNTCVMDIALDFLDNPGRNPDTDCVDEIGNLQFAVLETPLTAYTYPQYRVSGVYPKNWIEIGPGAWQRTTLGITAMIQQAVPETSKESVLGIMTNAVGVTGNLEVSDEIEANGLEWTVYSFELNGLSSDIILAEKDGTTCMILFSCTPDDHDYYYKHLVLPSVAAFTLE